MIGLPIVMPAREIMMIRTATARESLGSPADVAEYLQLPEKTLAEWRSRGIGPQYMRVGRYVRYRWADVEAWLGNQQVIRA